MNKVIGFVIPIIPLIRSLKDQDRRFYVFVEQPLISILVTFVSLYLSEYLTNIPHKFDALFFRNFIEVYLSYQVANIIRDGVNTDPHITTKLKLVLNWHYSVFSYILFTAADRIVKAGNEKELLFAYSIVTFSILWPIFSQFTSTYLWTPLMFSKFPKRSLLMQLANKKATVEKLLENEESVWNIRWIHWFKKSKRVKTSLVQYWIIKTLVGTLIGVFMTTLYYLIRWNLVGYSIEKPATLTNLITNIFR